MVDIEMMSDNLTILINEIVSIQEVVKYLKYNVKNPLSEPDVALPAESLILTKVHPYPFDPIPEIKDVTEIRVYYPEGAFDGSGAVAQTFIYFDIICAKTLWLIKNDGKRGIRPYMIVKYLIDHFKDKSIETLGRVQFISFEHLHVNEKFDCFRLEANVTLFNG